MRLVAGLIGSAVLGLAAAPAALAATTVVGSQALVANGGSPQAIGPMNSPVFQGDASGGYVVSSPVTGTVVSWSFLSAGVATGKQFSLRVLRAADATGQNWTGVGTSAPVAVTTPTGTDGVNGPFTTSLPIQAGDRIALQPVDDIYTPIEAGVFGQDGIRYFSAAFADGATAALAPGSGADNGQVVPVQATVQYTTIPQRTLTVVLAGTGSGSVTGGQSPSIACPTACSAQYPDGTTVTLTEHPDPGSSFAGWGDACSGLSTTCQVTLTANTDVAAIFNKGQPPPAPRNSTAPSITGTPRAGQQLKCAGDTWVGGGTFSIAWFETQLFPPLLIPQTTQVASQRTIIVADYPPGAKLSCTVTLTNAAGSASASATPVKMLASAPALRKFVSVKGVFVRGPTIDSSVGFGAVNTCTTGQWAHYPRSYRYDWFALPLANSPLSAGTRVGSGPKLTLSGAEESLYLVCRVTAINAAGAGVALSNRYVVPAFDPGVQLNAMEITQGVQTPEVPTRNPFDATDDHVSYLGVNLPWQAPGDPPVTVKLAEHHATVVRVYANTRIAIGAHAVPTVLLFALRGGRVLAPGAIAPDQLPPASGLPVGPLGEDPNTDGQRYNPGGAYTFTLPWSWTTGDVTFEAEVKPAASRFGLRCLPCAQTGTLLLGPEHFNVVTAAYMDPLAFKLNTNHGTYLPTGDPGPDPNWAQTQAVIPFPIYVPPYKAELDGTGVINAVSITQGLPCLVNCTVTLAGDATDPTAPFYHLQVKMLLQKVVDWANSNDTLSSHFPFGVVPSGLGFSGGVTDNNGGSSVLYGDGQPRAMSVDSRPVDGMAHEFEHGLGLPHADLICGGQLKVNGGSEPWPPNNDGAFDGVGLDTSSTSPYTIIHDTPRSFTSPATTYYDLMSYCTGTGDWNSVRNWNRDVDYHAPGPTFARDAQPSAYRTDPPATLRDTRTLAVTAMFEIGSPAVTMEIVPDAGAPTPAGPSDTYALAGLDATGHVIAHAGATGSFVHIDHAIGLALIEGRIAAAGLREVDLLQNGQPIARYHASAHLPTVTLLFPRRGARVGSGGAATIRWRSNDADHLPLEVTVRYSPDGGVSWHTIYIGPDRGTATVPSYLLSASKDARVRIYVSDGWSEAIQTSPRFIAAGAPPIVTITRPRVGLRLSSGAALNLVGTAYDDTGALLTGHSLVWRAGRRVLGKGPLLAATDLPAGATRITLTARDRHGRTATAAVVIKVTPGPPVLTLLRAPRSVRSNTRSVMLRVAALAPATLTVGRLRTEIDAHPRRISVAIPRGRNPVVLTITLRSGRYVSRTLVVIARRSR